MTKPSRSRSQGRLARAGSSLRCDSALAWPKLPTPSGVKAISAPPATMMSASPYWIRRPARPIECVDVVQAVTSAMFGPRSPNWIEICPAVALMMLPGIRNGEILRGDFDSSHRAVFSSMVDSPPMPPPIATPMRGELASVTSKPESLIAWTAEAMPNGTNGSNFRTSFGERYSSTLNPCTCPPMRTGKALTSITVMGPTPLRPLTMPSQAVATVLPRGETMPRPVTTTLRLDKLSPLDGAAEGLDGKPEPPSVAAR